MVVRLDVFNLALLGKFHGARVAGVDEPLLRNTRALIEIEFGEIAELKGLRPLELIKLIEKFGSAERAASAIGASEAFVRQHGQKTKR